MKNKICFFNSEMTWGGGEKWHYETAEEFLSKGYDVTIVGNIDSEIIKKSKMNKIQTSEFKISNRSFLNVFLLIKLIRYFRKKKYDIVIANLPIDMKLLAIISFFVMAYFFRKIALTIEGRENDLKLGKLFLKTLIIFVILNATPPPLLDNCNALPIAFWIDSISSSILSKKQETNSPRCFFNALRNVGVAGWYLPVIISSIYCIAMLSLTCFSSLCARYKAVAQTRSSYRSKKFFPSADFKA